MPVATRRGGAAPPTGGGATSTRIPALDGLRGIAAVVVVVHHVLLTSLPLADAQSGLVRPGPGSVAWWLSYTPAHLLWAGTEAVLTFFVLSGFVLAMPWAAGRGPSWRTYYPQRVVRLYLPVLGAVLLSVALYLAVDRSAAPAPDASSWVLNHVRVLDVGDVLHDAWLLDGVGPLNTAFWSLQWEVLFSLLLPVFLLALLRHRGAPGAKAVALLACVAAGAWSTVDPLLPTVFLTGSLLYLPVFGLGVLMCQQLAALRGLGERFDAAAAPVRAGVVAVVVVALLADWPLRLLPTALVHREVLTRPVAVLGACGLVWLAACTTLGRRACTGRAVSWLGLRSFSLYLVHEPIVVTTAFALGEHHSLSTELVVAVPLSLLAAEVFGRLVEVPSHRASRVVGRLAGRVAARA